MASLPSTMRAMVLSGPGDTAIEDIPMPVPTHGFVLLKVEGVLIHHNAKALIQASTPWFSLPYPCVPGGNAIGRVVALGPDTTTFAEGQLALISSTVRARDDPSLIVIWGGDQGKTQGAQRLYSSLVRNGGYAEYVLAPLENVVAVDEEVLTGSPSSGGLGYAIQDLLHLHANTLAYATLKSIGVTAGERVVITPATGLWSGAAVDTAVAMGATVFAAGRNASELARFRDRHGSRVHTVLVSGDLESDKASFAAALGRGRPADAVIDVSPPEATGSTNVTAAVSVLRPYGRIAAMGGRGDPTLPVSYGEMLFKNLTFRGCFMWRREDIEATVKLAEAGLLKLGKEGGHEVSLARGLGSLRGVIDDATGVTGHGRYIAFVP